MLLCCGGVVHCGVLWCKCSNNLWIPQHFPTAFSTAPSVVAPGAISRSAPTPLWLRSRSASTLPISSLPLRSDTTGQGPGLRRNSSGTLSLRFLRSAQPAGLCLSCSDAAHGPVPAPLRCSPWPFSLRFLRSASGQWISLFEKRTGRVTFSVVGWLFCASPHLSKWGLGTFLRL